MTRRWSVLFLVVLLATLVPATSVALLLSAPVARGATPPRCWVRNITQDTSGRSLNRLVQRAHAGDQLTIRGRCTERTTIDVDLFIRGVGDRRAVLDAAGSGRAVSVRYGATVELRRVVITGGSACFGGGVLSVGQTTLIGSVVRDNIAGGGGGIDNRRERLTLIRSVVKGNIAEAYHQLPQRNCSGHGGGIHSWGPVVLIDSVVRANHANSRSGDEGFDVVTGGGIATSSGLIARDSIVEGNSAWVGGGIATSGGRLILRDTWVTRNVASRQGGGILNSGRKAVLRRASVTGNAANRGGGVYNDRGTLELWRSTVTSNTAAVEGGGVWNGTDPDRPGTVTLDAASLVIGNSPDDCYGTDAC